VNGLAKNKCDTSGVVQELSISSKNSNSQENFCNDDSEFYSFIRAQIDEFDKNQNQKLFSLIR